jgi:hypothetical protein
MTYRLRWALRLVGWLLVLSAFVPHWEYSEQGPGGEERLSLGFARSPLFVRTRTVIHAGVANVADEEVMKRESHFEIASLSLLALVCGALLVSASNRRRA